jgi:hypothetical protein
VAGTSKLNKTICKGYLNISIYFTTMVWLVEECFGQHIKMPQLQQHSLQ